MKKRMLFLLAAILVLSLAACSPAKPAEAPKADAPKTEAPKTEAPKAAGKEITAVELLKNVNARHAIALAFDKSYITDVILGDGSQQVDFIVAKNLAIDAQGQDFRAKYPEGWLHYDAKAAGDAWAKAKQELGFEKVKVTLLTSDTELSKKISEYLQAQLTKNLPGIEVVLDQQPAKNMFKMANEGKYDLQLGGWGPDYGDPMTFLDMFLPDSDMNRGKYMGKDYQDTVLSAKSGDLAKGDPKARWEALQEAEKNLIERDTAVVPIYQSGYSYLHNPKVKGILHRALTPEYAFAYGTTEVVTDGKKMIRMTASADITTLDITKATDTQSFTIHGNVFEGLTEINAKNEVAPKLAEKWEVSADGLKYVFHMRKDAKWSNGTPLTAHDFEFAWKRMADPATASEYQFILETAGIKNAREIFEKKVPVAELGVKATDDYTLEVNLTIPCPYFLRLLARPNFYPINEKFFKEHEKTYGTTIQDTIFCGAYVMTKMENGYGWTMEKNPTYYDKANVLNDGVTYRIVKDPAAGVNLYKSGEIDRCFLSGEFVEQNKDSEAFLQKMTCRIFYLSLNINNR